MADVILNSGSPDGSIGDCAYPFYALRVRTKFEKQAGAFLSALGYQTYLPVYRERKQWSDRVKESESPFFPGYVFCRLDLTEIRPVIRAPGFMSIVGVGRTPVPISSDEIHAVMRTLSSGVFARPCPFLKVGQTVLIKYGPLSGIEGLLLRVQNSHRIVVSISLLQRSIAAEIAPEWVIPLSEAGSGHTLAA